MGWDAMGGGGGGGDTAGECLTLSWGGGGVI